MNQESTQSRPVHQFRRNDPVRWSPGEREALIAEALAKGRVTQIPRGQSAYTQDSAKPQSFGSMASR